MLTQRAAGVGDSKKVCSVKVLEEFIELELSHEEVEKPPVVQLSLEDDAKYAALLNFCDRLTQSGKGKRWEFERAGIDFVFDELFRQKPGSCSRERVHLLWFILGTAFIKASDTCLRITRCIDEQTVKAILKDKSELCNLEIELAFALKEGKNGLGGGARVRHLEYKIAGKNRIMVAEAKKVDLLYGLLLQKHRTYSRKSNKEQLRRSHVGARVESLVGRSL